MEGMTYGREEDEEDISSYWMTLRKEKILEVETGKNQNGLNREFGLEQQDKYELNEYSFLRLSFLSSFVAVYRKLGL